MKKAEYKKLRLAYSEKKALIGERLAEFREVLASADDGRIFEELAFCICTAGASAKMGMRESRSDGSRIGLGAFASVSAMEVSRGVSGA